MNLCKNCNLIDIVQQKVKKAQSENGNYGVDKKNDLVQPKLLWLRWCERRDSSQIKSRQLLAGLWDCFRNRRKYKVQNIPSDGVQRALLYVNTIFIRWSTVCRLHSGNNGTTTGDTPCPAYKSSAIYACHQLKDVLVSWLSVSANSS